MIPNDISKTEMIQQVFRTIASDPGVNIRSLFNGD